MKENYIKQTFSSLIGGGELTNFTNGKKYFYLRISYTTYEFQNPKINKWEFYQIILLD